MTQTHGAITISLLEVGNDLVLSYSGSVDLTDLTFDVATDPGITYFAADTITTQGSVDRYTGVTTSGTFHNAGLVFATSKTGDPFGITKGNITLPQGYTSGTSISGSHTYANKSFNDVSGLAAGNSLTWVLTSDSEVVIATITVGPTVPEVEEWTAIFSLGLLGFACYRRQKGSEKRKNFVS